MKKFILTISISFVVGFIAGNAFWYLASPLWIDRVVSERLVDSDSAKVVLRGSFVDADTVHKGKGIATIYTSTAGQHTLRLSEFEVTNGPDLEVWLVVHPDIKSSEDVENSEWVSLGQLKGNIGDQNYFISAGTDISQFQSAVIWCEQFGVLFASAKLLNP